MKGSHLGLDQDHRRPAGPPPWAMPLHYDGILSAGGTGPRRWQHCFGGQKVKVCYMYVCIHVLTYICVYVYICIYVCILTYAYLYIHIHRWVNMLSTGHGIFISNRSARSVRLLGRQPRARAGQGRAQGTASRPHCGVHWP